MKDLDKYLNSFPKYQIEIGIFSENSKRKDTVNLGVTNADIMFINENGSPLQHIPARPVLELTIKWVNDTKLIDTTLSKAIDTYLNTGNINEVDKIIDRMCVKIQSHARKIIRDNDGQLAPNAPSTIAKKGDNYPLFDTGQLSRSITCRAIKL